MKIGKMDGMPSDITMFRWIGDKAHPFSEVYKRAKELLVARYEEEIQEIASEALVGEIVTERDAVVDGDVVRLTETRRADNVERAKVKIAARQWGLSHLMPSKHGRNADPEAGKPNEQLAALFASLKSGPAQ